MILPLLGPLHLRMPRYNVETVAAAARAFAPDTVALAPLPPGALADPSWQACDDIALPHTIVPWARRAGVRLLEIGEVPADPAAETDFLRYLEGRDEGREPLQRVGLALRPVTDLLSESLTTTDVRTRLVPAVRAYQEERERAFGEGPGTGWQRSRGRDLAARLRARVAELGAERVVVALSLDDVPSVLDALDGWAELEPLIEPESDETIERRSFLDHAMLGEADDPAALLEGLGRIDAAEARYHEANVLLRHAHVAEALERLEAASHTDFQDPYFLPGFLLSRLGQLYDLAGRRDAALRCYRGVRALSFAPPEAAAAAEAGLLGPFTWPGDPRP